MVQEKDATVEDRDSLDNFSKKRDLCIGLYVNRNIYVSLKVF